MYQIGIARIPDLGLGTWGCTFIGIAECGGLSEVEAASCSDHRTGIGEENRRRKAEVRVVEVVVVVRGSDGFGGREGLERRRENDHEHCSREEARESNNPQHLILLLLLGIIVDVVVAAGAGAGAAAEERSSPPPLSLKLEEIEEIEMISCYNRRKER